MNTVEKGDAFELRSYEIIKRVIDAGQLGFMPEVVRICRQKKYYSVLRQSDVVLDLTLEIWPPGADRFVMLIVIECKDYKTRVPVSKIDDFYTRIVGIGGVRVKGIFISNSPLQSGGLKTAENVGMMVIQAVSDDDYKIVLHKRTDLSVIPTIKQTEVHDIPSDIEPLVKLIDSELGKAWTEIFEADNSSYGIDRLSKSDIAAIAESIFLEMAPESWDKAHGLTFQRVVEYLNQQFNIEVVEIDEQSPQLGFCDFNNNTIGINKSLKGTNRELFLLCHEFGHFMLHSKLTINQQLYESFEDFEGGFLVGNSGNKFTNIRHWIEWQANYFASSLTLPTEKFKERVTRFQHSLGYTIGIIPITDEVRSRKEFNVLVFRLADHFNVTKTSVIYKLNDLNWMKDHSRLKSIGQIIQGLNFLKDFDEY